MFNSCTRVVQELYYSSSIKLFFGLITFISIGYLFDYRYLKTENLNIERENFSGDLFADEKKYMEPAQTQYVNSSVDEQNRLQNEFFDRQLFPGILGPYSGPVHLANIRDLLKTEIGLQIYSLF